MSAGNLTPSYEALLLVLVASMLLAFWRLLKGPSIADRVVALDVVGIAGVGATAVGAVAFGYSSLLDVAILLALISFVGTAAFAGYIERRGQ